MSGPKNLNWSKIFWDLSVEGQGIPKKHISNWGTFNLDHNPKRAHCTLITLQKEHIALWSHFKKSLFLYDLIPKRAYLILSTLHVDHIPKRAYFFMILFPKERISFWAHFKKDTFRCQIFIYTRNNILGFGIWFYVFGFSRSNG